ncbi:transporter substrate-binding domain-containing protein [Buttiauxella gaviniae]|uniref:transporter substrate-binding domain-containing protein n=1 Tax=Buttiauxella gaviniae TaxID=82990 RepID=UPI003976D098
MSTLERISSHKVVNIGYRDAPPYSYKTNEGHVVGYVIDLCKDVTESMKKVLHIKDLVVNFIPTPVTMRTTMLNHNIIDMDCSVNTDTVSRENVVLFSRHYLSVYTRFGSIKGNISSYSDLAGRTISVAKGTTDLINMNSLNRLQKLNIMVFTQPTMKDAFAAMSSHKSYATAMNEVSLRQLIETSEDMKEYQISTLTLGTPQDLGIMLRHDDIELKKLVDKNLAARFNRSDFKQFYEQWFNSKLPGENINLHLPLSTEMYHYITRKS